MQLIICLKIIVEVVVILFQTENNQWRTEYMSNITATIKDWWSCWWSPEKPEAHRACNQKKILFLSEWWGTGPHRVNMKFDNTVLNDLSYLTWRILEAIIIIIDTPVSFGLNCRSEWELWKAACGSSFYIIIDWWYLNIDSINVHLWNHNGSDPYQF